MPGIIYCSLGEGCFGMVPGGAVGLPLGVPLLVTLGLKLLEPGGLFGQLGRRHKD